MGKKERACGTCRADETWCWMFTVNEGECPCAHCHKNPDCDIVMEDDDNKGIGICEKFNTVWPD